MAKAKAATNWVVGPAFADDDSPTGFSQYMYNIANEAEHAEWWAAWEQHLATREARPEATVRRGGGPGDGPGKPPQPRLAEVKEWLNAYEGRFPFLLDMRAIAQGKSKYDRFTPGQYNALVKMLDREIEQKKQNEREANATLRDDADMIRFDNFPYGTFHFAVPNDGQGNLTFIRIDKVPEKDKFGATSRWFNWVFVKHEIGGNDVKLGAARPNQPYVGQFENLIRKILSDPMEAMTRYGKEIGKCGDCGRRLTNEESRVNGIGPICAAKGLF